MADLKIRLEGQGSEEAAGLLAQALEKELGHEPAIKRLEASGDQKTKLDPVAVAALLVAIPSGLLAAFDLVQRFKKKEKAAVVIEQAQSLVEGRPGLRITISTPGGTTVRLDRMDPNDLIDLAIKVEGGG